MAGRRPLGLVMVLMLLAFLPASALAGSGDTLRHHSPAASGLLAYTTGEDEAPADQAPTEPAPSETAPTEPDPAPTEPAPTEPAPAPSEPAPTEPAPAPSEPAPSEPAPSEPAPSDPLPPSEDWAPYEPAPRDDRAPAVRPPSDERLVSSATEAESTVAPVAAVPSTDPADASTTPEPSRADDADTTEREEKAVRVALRRLGIGTIAAPAQADVAGEAGAAAPAPSCTPIGTVGIVPASETVEGVAVPSVVRPHRAGGEPPLVRGPPAPLESPSAPFAAAGSGSVATGGASGERDCGILADQIVLTLADAGFAAVADCRDHVAPAPANAAARAPPVA